jgi:hypothetical protein
VVILTTGHPTRTRWFSPGSRLLDGPACTLSRTGFRESEWPLAARLFAIDDAPRHRLFLTASPGLASFGRPRANYHLLVQGRLTRAEEYLKRSADAEAMAAKGDGPYRHDMQSIARQWRNLARQAGELPKGDPRLKDPE